MKCSDPPAPRHTTAQTPNLSAARNAGTAPATRSRRGGCRLLNARAPSRLATSRITMISNAPQPIGCSTLSSAPRPTPVRRHQPVCRERLPAIHPTGPGPAPVTRRSVTPSSQCRGKTTGKTGRVHRRHAGPPGPQNPGNTGRVRSKNVSRKEEDNPVRVCGRCLIRSPPSRRSDTPRQGLP